jgi:hypothetical protein
MYGTNTTSSIPSTTGAISDNCFQPKNSQFLGIFFHVSSTIFSNLLEIKYPQKKIKKKN